MSGQVARGGRKATRRCPDCGARLLVAYKPSAGRRGLELVMTCAADCGYARRPVRLIQGHRPD